MIIAIDGPAGSGKTTTAQEVARRLGFLHLDSGALYRAFAVAAFELGWASPAGVVPASRIAELAAKDVGAGVEAGAFTVRLDGRRLDQELRSSEVAACASKISAFPEIRRRVDDLLRDLVSRHPGGVVCEGRDMGTVVFPCAQLKVFMDAASHERARRRLLQRGVEPSAVRLREETRQLVARDKADSEREVSPLRRALDAVLIDTTRLDFEQQVELILAEARKRVDSA